MTEDPPKYRRIADDLRAAIRGGAYPPGTALPSKSSLMAVYKERFGAAALGTINAALDVLRQEELIETRQGRGTFVVDPLPDEDAPSEFEILLAELAELRKELRRMRRRMEAYEAGNSDPEVKRRLAVLDQPPSETGNTQTGGDEAPRP